MWLNENEINETREAFFRDRKWQKKQCSLCHGTYYTKRDIPNCGSYDCSGGYRFLDIPSPKHYLELFTCASRLQGFFSALGFTPWDPIAIFRERERTLLASTAGQTYDSLIYGKATNKHPQRRVIIQPVVRLQGAKMVGVIDGFSTAFVHAATESWNISMYDHFKTLDAWLNLFSSLGFYAGNLCLKSAREDNDWAGLTITSDMLDINYGGLEIGIANLFFNIPHDGGMASVSDIGVGLERFVWSINKSPSYFDGIGHLSYVTIQRRMVLDAIRSATLMAASGVMPEHKNHGSKLRALVSRISPEALLLNLYELVRYFYSQWERFIPLPVALDRAYDILWDEVERDLNLEVSQTVKGGGNRNQGHEEFLQTARRNGSLVMREFWQKNKERLS